MYNYVNVNVIYKIVLIEPPYHCCSTGWFAAGYSSRIVTEGSALLQITLVALRISQESPRNEEELRKFSYTETMSLL